QRQIDDAGLVGQLRRDECLLHLLAPSLHVESVPRIAEAPWESWLPEVTRLTQVAPSGGNFSKKRALDAGPTITAAPSVPARFEVVCFQWIGSIACRCY
ncbi:MAG: hypothetical protein ACREL5_12340, partial [Gemmatimonadales bacterium]